MIIPIMSEKERPVSPSERPNFRYPDVPVDFVKKEPEYKFKDGIEKNGVHLLFAEFIISMELDKRPDYDTLSDCILSDDEDPVDNIDHDSETSNLCTSLFRMDVDSEKKIKIKKERKSRSPSPLPKSSHKHKKSKEHKSDRRNEHKSDHKSDSRSDSNSPSHSSRKSKRPVVPYSPSPPPPPSPERVDIKINIVKKEEKYEVPQSDESQHLFGAYTCEVCNITMNSYATYSTHRNGKKHRKALKAKNAPKVAALSIPATVLSENDSRYPKPRPGVIRKKVQTISQIQHICEGLNVPCPGLNLVTEIQGIENVQYYCAMCDCVCSSNSIIPHITGYKHQLKTVKEFKPGLYEEYSHKAKHDIERNLISVLRAIQKKDGMGRMAVEEEELSSPNQSFSGDLRDMPSTSWGAGLDPRSDDFKKKYDRSTIPNTDASDYFCEICQSHMNSIQMWEAHVRGKRHLTNLKKLPGDRPSKLKTIPKNDAKCKLLDRLESESFGEPSVGLRHIRETYFAETKSYSYTCHLCGSCHTSLDIIEHLFSLKHRTKYLDKIDYPGREVITGMSESASYSLVRQMCEEVEDTEGPGRPEVHVHKTYY